MNAPECQKVLQLSLALCSTSFRVLSPTRRSVGTGRREPWKRGCSLLTFATDFTCHSFENLSKFSQSDYPRAYMEFCQNLNSLKEKKKTFKPVLTWSTGRYAPGYCFQRKPSSGLVIGRLLPLDGAVFSRQLD